MIYKDHEEEEGRLYSENSKWHPDRVFAAVCLVSILIGLIVGLIQRFM